MKFRDALISRTAAAALVLGMAQSFSAMAQDTTPVPPASPASANQTVKKVQTSVSTVREWNPVNPLGPLAPMDQKTLMIMIAAMGLLGAGVSVYAGKKGIRGGAFRAAAAGAIAFTMMNWEQVTTERETPPAELVVLVDKSDSQALGGRDKTTDEFVQKLLAGAGQNGIHVRVVPVATTRDGNGNDGSNLFAAFDALTDLPRENLGAVIMATDGRVHDTKSVDEIQGFLGEGIPLHAFVSGTDQEFDRRIELQKAPRQGVVGKPQTIRFQVSDDGSHAKAGAPVRVVLSSDGQELASKIVTPGQPSDISFNVMHAGTNIIALTTEALEGELTDLNNRVVVPIEGSRENLNVLIVTGEPSQSSRLARDIFTSDPDVNLVQFSLLRPTVKQDDTPVNEMSAVPFPFHQFFEERLKKDGPLKDGEKRKQFDLVVFDHYANFGAIPPDYLANVVPYIKEGGSLLVFSGKEYAAERTLFDTEVAPVLSAQPAGSVIEKSYKPSVNEKGKRHPVTRDLPGADDKNPAWGPWLMQVDAKPLSGDVVMEGADKKPLVILDRKDKGRVATILSDQLWLWGRGYEGGGPYLPLMQKTVQWLLHNPALEEEALRMRTDNGRLIIERQTMADKSDPMKIVAPSGKIVNLTPSQTAPGLWQASLPANELEIGLYSAAQDGKTPLKTYFNIGTANPREFSRTVSTLETVKPLADKTGGYAARMADGTGNYMVPAIKLLQPDDAKKGLSGADWVGVRATTAGKPTRIDREPVVPLPLSIGFVLAMMALSFAREGNHKWLRPENWRAKKQASGDQPSV